MSLLDRAFVKAYTRTHSLAPSTSSTGGPHLTKVPHLIKDLGVTKNSEAVLDPVGPIPDAVAWIEMADESYFRVDVGHTQAPRRKLSTQIPTIPAARLVEPTGYRNEIGLSSNNRVAQSPPSHSFSARPQATGFSPAVISHTLTAYDLPTASFEPNRVTPKPMVHEAHVEQFRMRIDDAHQQRQWVPPRVEESATESREYYRPSRDREQAAEFARAKMEALAAEALVPAKPVAPIDAPAVHSTSPVPTARPFEPVWEVDAYEYPNTIVELFGDAKIMKSIGAPLDHAVANGLRSVLVTSVERGAGRTSVAIGIAVSAAAAGLRVAVVDADTFSAGLAETLRLDIEFGWLEAMRGNVQLEEIAIRSIEDQFIVVPSLVSSLRPQSISQEFDRMMSHLRESFDLIVIDGAPWETMAVALQDATTVDAAILVVDVRDRDVSRESKIQSDLRRAGVAGLGIVENFVSCFA